MEVLVQAGWPVARACEGSGVCGKCAVRVLRGGQDLTPASDLERSSLFREGFDDEYRLSCLVKVTSPIAVQADYW
jgi:adenylate cyclase